MKAAMKQEAEHRDLSCCRVEKNGDEYETETPRARMFSHTLELWISLSFYRGLQIMLFL